LNMIHFCDRAALQLQVSITATDTIIQTPDLFTNFYRYITHPWYLVLFAEKTIP